MSHLLEVLCAKIKINIMEGLVGQKSQTCGINFQYRLTLEFSDADKIFRYQPILSLIGTNRKRFLIMKRGSHRL